MCISHSKVNSQTLKTKHRCVVYMKEKNSRWGNPGLKFGTLLQSPKETFMCHSLGFFKSHDLFHLHLFTCLGNLTVCKVLDDDRQNCTKNWFLNCLATHYLNQMNWRALLVIFCPAREANFQILFKFSLWIARYISILMFWQLQVVQRLPSFNVQIIFMLLFNVHHCLFHYLHHTFNCEHQITDHIYTI